jgi:hypothetical protein
VDAGRSSCANRSTSDFVVPVNPADTQSLDPIKLASLPDGYARLGYLQAGLG